MISKNEQETLKVAGKAASKVKNGGIVCLFGELGAGKTVFAKGIAKKLGIDDFKIKSPTYTYIREYRKKSQSIYHIDLYRLEEIDDLLAQEIDELTGYKKNILIIEWADKMLSCLPEKRIDVYMEYIDENSRKIKIKE